MTSEKFLVVSTYHKAGTNFLLQTFQKISERLRYRIWLRFYHPILPEEGWDICIHQHSRVEDLLRTHDLRGIRCIRHPMSLIYSATLYHEKCTEAWVDIPLQEFSSKTFWAATSSENYNRIRDKNIDEKTKQSIMSNPSHVSEPCKIESFDSIYEFKGLTYRQFLASLPTLEDKILFEMRNYTRGVIHGMLNFPSDSRICTVKLEDISHGTDLDSLKNMFTHLGFRGSELMICMNIAVRNTLWYRHEVGQKSRHETTGVDETWRTYFRGEVLEEYRRLFGYAEAALGYPEFSPPNHQQTSGV